MQALKNFAWFVPKWQDTVYPSRWSRRLPMIAGWMMFVPCALLIFISICSTHWAVFDFTEYQEPRSPFRLTSSEAADYVLRTAGHCSLFVCYVHKSSPLVDVSDTLTMSGRGILAFWLLLAMVITFPITTYLSWLHGWSKLANQRTSYILSATAVLITLVITQISWTLAMTGKPDQLNASVGWAFWLCFVAFLFHIVALVLILCSKPTGLIRITKSGLLHEKDDPTTAAGESCLESTSSASTSAGVLEQGLVSTTKQQ